MFKNETHNHPTEIEPFGGAATCLGGAIRDPLSGRSYVYQAMRVTGAGDPTAPAERDAQSTSCRSARSCTTAAARLFFLRQPDRSGDRTWFTRSIIRAMSPSAWRSALLSALLRWKTSSAKFRDPGDIIILLGGRTGRDGCGGATGSSKTPHHRVARNLRCRGTEGQPAGGAQDSASVPQSGGRPA